MKYPVIYYMFALIWVFLSTTVNAQQFLNEAQVEALFSGKTVSGEHLKRGFSFQQYFDSDGTVYSAQDGASRTGKWRVSSDGSHCIKWINRDKEKCRRLQKNRDGSYTRIKEKGGKQIAVAHYSEFALGNLLSASTESIQQMAIAANQVNKILWDAVSSKNLGKVQQALQAGADVNHAFKKGRTVLFLAADDSDGGIIETLIKNGANVNARDYAGNTPLIYAVKQKDLKAVQLFLHHGANAKAQDDSGETAFDIARRKDLFEIAEIVKENQDSSSALGLFVDMRGRDLSEQQFRSAAKKAFLERNWKIVNAENNQVSGVYERNDRIFKSTMIYEPNLLLIKFDYAMGYRKPNYLEALKTLFFRELENQ